MPAATFQLQAATRMERHAATQMIRRAISEAGGWITGFRQFSNHAVSIDLEITAARLPELHAAIEATGVSLSPPRSGLPAPSSGQDEMQGGLLIQFCHDEPDLIIPVPAVPG